MYFYRKTLELQTLNCAVDSNIPGNPVFAHYTSARRWYAPHDLAKVNNSEIERVTKMDIKKKLSNAHNTFFK